MSLIVVNFDFNNKKNRYNKWKLLFLEQNKNLSLEQKEFDSF